MAVAKPNILLIVADDLGYSDIGPFGGNINTPVLDELGKQGMLFSNFHVLPTCSPTRSAMLTGNDNHVAGMGIMSEMDYPALHNQSLAGYMGALSDQVVTIPELLRENNYHTYMVGKWHLGEKAGQDPYDRGFEQTFILGTGGGSHWNDRKPLAPPQKVEYSRNGVGIEPPEDFYSSRNYTDSLIQFIERNKADEKPFFAFLSYTAVHDPLHAPKEYIDKYKGKFDMGWDSLWVQRLNNLKALGIVPQDVKSIPNPSIKKWSSLTPEHRAEYARDMEVYAAMLEYMDMSIGRVFEYLKKAGMYENTMIIFLSDNGANGAMATSYPGNEDGEYLGTFNNSLDNRGLKGSYIEMGPGWAWASSSPFRYFKTFTTEGGIRAPLIVKMPGENKGGQWNKNFVHVTDFMPTLLEITGASYPQQFKGKPIHPLIGKSMTPTLKLNTANIHAEDGMGYELFEMKAYIKGDWKILRLPVPMGTGNWELYNITNDPGETTDLSSKFPDIKEQLIKAWGEYAKHNNVYDHKGHYDSVYRKNF
ncbi:MAG TPA: arylsulfatase [Chitinophagaceae bacterium]|nr:arylsulfatase [Chitinophagaceae bacterium]